MGVGGTLGVGACQWPKPRVAESQDLGQGKGSWGRGGGKTGWTSPALKATAAILDLGQGN